MCIIILGQSTSNLRINDSEFLWRQRKKWLNEIWIIVFFSLFVQKELFKIKIKVGTDKKKNPYLALRQNNISEVVLWISTAAKIPG